MSIFNDDIKIYSNDSDEEHSDDADEGNSDRKVRVKKISCIYLLRKNKNSMINLVFKKRNNKNIIKFFKLGTLKFSLKHVKNSF